MLNLDKYKDLYQLVTTNEQDCHELDHRFKQALDRSVDKQCLSKKQQYTNAFAWFEKAAAQDQAIAQYYLARYYAVGQGCEQNEQLAFEYFKKAAEQGVVEAYISLASGYRDAVSESLAFTWLSNAASVAENYFSDAMAKNINPIFKEKFAEIYYCLADWYAQGKGTSQNDEQAFKYYKLASNHGENSALFVVGNWAAEGRGCEKDEELAFKAYKLAAERGETRAHLIVGNWAAEGRGCEKDEELAVQAYKLAAERGENQAEANYCLLLRYLHELRTRTERYNDDVEEWLEDLGRNLDAEWIQQLSDQHKAEVFYWLGYLGDHGFLDNSELSFYPEYRDNEMDSVAFDYYEKAVQLFENISEESEVKFLAFKALADCFEKHRGISHKYYKPTEHEKNTFEYDKSLINQEAKRLYSLIGPDKLKQLAMDEILAVLPHSRKAFEFLHQRIAIHISKGEFESAEQFIDHIQSFRLEGSSENSMKEIARTNVKMAKEIQEKNQQLYKALHEKEKEMLSFFTHTMRNALATAPESLRQAIHLLGGEVYEKDTKHYQAINKIAALFSTLSLTDCLIDTFKQSISDPQEFKQSWLLDHSGEATPKWVIASALRQALNRIIFMSDTTELRKLLNSPETALIKATRKSFIEEVLPLNIDSHGVEVFYGWTLAHIPAVDVSIADCDTLNFGVNQIRFSLLFAITSELILNALKYWDGENRIQIGWQLAEQGNYVFSVKNHCQANASSNLAGTHKGLAFIKRLVELLGEQAQFVCKSEGQLFTAELILTKALFDGES